MTRAEFSVVIGWITAAIGKPIAEGTGEDGEIARRARTDVYFELLGDLPAEVLMTAAKRVVLEHPWATFPSVAELRQAASATAQGKITPLSGHEAWAMAAKFGRAYDPALRGAWFSHGKLYDSQAEALLEGVPALVQEAMRAFGLVALTTAIENFARPQFIKIYESLSEREERRALMPPNVRTAIAAIADKREVPPAVEDARAKVFKAIEG